jgi:hypothetical protein
MSTFALGVLAVLIISALGFYGHKWQVPVLDAIYHYNYFLVILLVYWIAYKALLQPVIFNRLPSTEEAARELSAPVVSVPETDPFDEPEVRKYIRSGLDETSLKAL